MKTAVFSICLLVLVLTGTPALGNDIQMSAGTSGSKMISVSGMINVDACYTPGSSVTVEIYQDGCVLITTLTLTVDTSNMNKFSGMTTVMASGTYTAFATGNISMGLCTQPYAIKATVAVP